MLTLDIWQGDSRERLQEIPTGSVQGVVCDPPYELTSLSRGGSLRTPGTGPFSRIALATKPKGGFMGQEWDASGIAFDPIFWGEVFRILESGGKLKAFSAPRTFHRMGVVWRELGFLEIRPEAWVFGSGMPKSLDVSKAIDKHYGKKRETVGFKRGVGGENLNDLVHGKAVRSTRSAGAKGVGAYGVGAKQVATQIPITAPATPDAKRWAGYGTGHKPAWEPLLTAKKP